MIIRRFEDIESWRRARELGAEVYGLSTKGKFRKDFSFRDQVQRACISIMANIAEGYGKYRPTDSIRCLTIAQASTAEVQSHLNIAVDLHYITQPEFERLYGLSEGVRRLIGGFIRHLHRQPGARNEKPAASPHISQSSPLLH